MSSTMLRVPGLDTLGHLHRLTQTFSTLGERERIVIHCSPLGRAEHDDSPGIQRSVFVLPAVKNKNRQARAVVLNDAAQASVERKRDQHPVYDPEVFGREAPFGFRDLRAHDLRHTLGRRL